MQTDTLLKIISSFNRFWTTGNIEAGIQRDALELCLQQLNSKEVIVLKGGTTLR